MTPQRSAMASLPAYLMTPRLRAAYLALISSLALSSCSSTAPTILPIAGRTFEVLSIDGRARPTIKTLGRTALCDSRSVARVTLAFNTDGSFTQTKSAVTGGASSTGGSFTEMTLGSVAVVNSEDTANVRDGVLQLRLTGISCGRELLVARGI